jgi:hypothetical protein
MKAVSTKRRNSVLSLDTSPRPRSGNPYLENGGLFFKNTIVLVSELKKPSSAGS